MTAKRSESLKFMSVSAYAGAAGRGRPRSPLSHCSVGRGWVRVLLQNSECGLAGLDGLCLLFSLFPSLLPCPMPDELALHPSDLVVRYNFITFITFSDFPIRLLLTFGPLQSQATTFTVFAASRICPRDRACWRMYRTRRRRK